MQTKIIKPSTEAEWLALRPRDLTSTDIAALFGCSPYATPYELWHRKKEGTVVTLEENEDMEWGKALQDAIADRIAKKEGWKVRRMDEYIRIPELRIGSSFDFEALGGAKDEAEPIGIEVPQRILEIKNVNQFIYKDNWIVHDDGEIEAPPHIEFQVQHQMLVSGIHRATIAALVGGSRPKMLHRTLDEKVAAAIKAKAAAFWASIDAGIPPEPNFEADAEFIFDMYGKATEGKVLNAHDDLALYELAAEHDRLGYEMRELDKKRDAVKAQLLTRIGDVEKVQGDGFSITAGMVAGGHVSYDRKPYRNFRVTFKKSKAVSV